MQLKLFVHERTACHNLIVIGLSEREMENASVNANRGAERRDTLDNRFVREQSFSRLKRGKLFRFARHPRDHFQICP